MHFDFTLNVPTIIILLGMVWIQSRINFKVDTMWKWYSENLERRNNVPGTNQ